jgi:hypothetical protein
MGADTPSPSHIRQSRKWRAWFGAWRLPRSPWVYVLVAAALLAASQILWMWHSWPVREILDAERPALGASL